MKYLLSILIVTLLPLSHTNAQTAGQVYVTTGNTNLRTGVSTNASIILTIPKASFVKVLDASVRDWIKVDYMGKTGYAHRSLLKSLSNMPTYTTRENTNLRERPTTSSAVIFTIPASTDVAIIESSNSEWWRAYYNYRIGFVHKTLLRASTRSRSSASSTLSNSTASRSNERSAGTNLSQSKVIDINTALSNRAVALTNIKATGGSTGSVVNAILRNNTSAAIRVGVTVREGLYLVNSGKGQNMVALQVFERNNGLRYNEDDEGRFIEIPANNSIPVSFNAICAEFDKDNPSISDIFTLSSIPFQVRSILTRISRYLSNNFDSELTPAQIAFWRMYDLSRNRPLSRKEIEETFSVTDEDWAISSRILNY